MSTPTPPALAAPLPPVPTPMAGPPGGPRIAENRWEWLDAIEMFNQTSPVALKPAAQLIAYSPLSSSATCAASFSFSLS